ncbi:putative isoflavone oxidoreductase [Viridothelium virens]|uniref:Putative isoflavone oxidoreductase n=1 Tax=Viridothelium virens TaxID=1048519 RepID=A0A6A6HG47_VIRVR|nr:putative isoflavone oxidoreductase [Viridothelium virens]
MPTPHTILVLGTGELGHSILHALASHPSRPASVTLTLLLRPSSLSTLTSSSTSPKASSLAALQTLGVGFIAADLATDSEEHLAGVFRGFDTVVGATGMVLPPGTQRKLCRAVLGAGVPCYFPWQFGADYDVIGRGSAQELFAEQIGVREMLRGQRGTRWVVVSVGMFMSFLFEEAFGGMVERRVKGVNALGGWGNLVTVTTVEGIAKVVAELVYVALEERDKVVFVAGETVTYGELADVVEEAMGKKVQRREWTLKYLKGELAKDPDDEMKKYRIVFGEGVGVAWDKETTFNAERGIETTGIREYAKKVLV